MTKLVWIIDKKKNKVFDNPVKLISKGMMQSTCGHAKKLIDNDLIFKSRYDAERYLLIISENNSLFQDENFGSRKIRHINISNLNSKENFTIYSRVSLEEKPCNRIGTYKQCIKLSLDNIKALDNFKVKDGSLSLSFFYKGKKEIISDLKIENINKNNVILTKKFNI